MQNASRSANAFNKIEVETVSMSLPAARFVQHERSAKSE
jgi:hypothetical protein